MNNATIMLLRLVLHYFTVPPSTQVLDLCLSNLCLLNILSSSIPFAFA
ncbi:hypothetical protein SLEP1_g45077 [Rubroshorea leprosula]|uniref:Uncharacterized protein n=1 Tax=Rubroshorea leprosula TaxID=152421 RepID=A0AAV5LIK6_9ROSI|nr:hypothetical protein SLEP1_g45077 [Rubroshorea leprosula]